MSARALDRGSSGLLVSFEGISGTGKTYYCGMLAERLEVPHFFVSEATDHQRTGLGAKILDALFSTQDRFFRSGHIASETALLLALKAFDYEAIAVPQLEAGKVVIEDRSVDSIAVYQSVLWAQGDDSLRSDAFDQLYRSSEFLRPLPQLTFVLVGDFDSCVERAARRDDEGYDRSQLELLRLADRGYRRLIEIAPERVQEVDVSGNQSDDEIIDLLEHTIMSRLQV